MRAKEMDTQVATEALRLLSSALIDATQLESALQEAGSIAPLDPQMSAEEMAAFVEFVAESGNPRQGERIYRREGLLCMTCHAIGGAGGSLGPDLTSLGASAPMDYIVDSLLLPQKKIKEGYHVVSVETKEGTSFAGTLESEDDRTITLRDPSDRKVVIAQADIRSQTISPVSLMPQGLTASLRRDELADLVSFLSVLGKEGDYKVSSKNWVCRFQYLDNQGGSSGFADILRHKPFGYVTSEDPRFEWKPLYAQVDGSLPLDEVPAMRLHRTGYHYMRFHINVGKAGCIALKWNGPSGHLWVGSREIESESDRFEFDAKVGLTTITLGIPESKSTGQEFSMEIVDIKDSTAQVQAINGR